MIPVVPFLCKKVRLRWRGVTATKASQRHEGLTLFSGEHHHDGQAHGSTQGFPYGGKWAFTRFLGHASTTESEAPKLLQHK